MSSNWIKMRKSLLQDGRVRCVTRYLCVTDVTVIGALVKLWCLADDFADEEGVIKGYTQDDIDSYIGISNFCNSLPRDWIDLTGEWVKLPEYLEHNKTTTKKREDTRRRVQKHRDKKEVTRYDSVTSVTSSTLILSNSIRDRGVGKEKEAPSPLWPDCEHLRMSEAESKTVLEHYQKNKYPIELLPKAAQVLDDWLGSTGKEAIKARKQPTHYRRMWADWVLESAQKLHKVSNPPAGGKLTNAQKAKQISNKIRSMNENGRSANSGFDGVSNSLLAANGSDRGALSSISGELPRERSANDEKSNSVVRKELATQLSAFDSRNSSSPESSPQVDAAEIIQSLTRKFDTNGTGKTEADRKLETEIPRTLEIITKEIGK